MKPTTKANLIRWSLIGLFLAAVAGAAIWYYVKQRPLADEQARTFAVVALPAELATTDTTQLSLTNEFYPN